MAMQKSAEGIVGRRRRSARAGHSPERGETARARTTGNERLKALSWLGVRLEFFHAILREDFSTKLKFSYREKNDASLGCRGRQ
jgi:hypothetical protein